MQETRLKYFVDKFLMKRGRDGYSFFFKHAHVKLNCTHASWYTDVIEFVLTFSRSHVRTHVLVCGSMKAGGARKVEFDFTYSIKNFCSKLQLLQIKRPSSVLLCLQDLIGIDQQFPFPPLQESFQGWDKCGPGVREVCGLRAAEATRKWQRILTWIISDSFT